MFPNVLKRYIPHCYKKQHLHKNNLRLFDYTGGAHPDAKIVVKQIKEALESIYQEKNVKVVAVNTINVKQKQRNKRGRMNPGVTAGYKKAIVTFAVGNVID